tara:strand:+ start:543 stop:644 length:102 start_codon:yes stop_codon:yes gene_type:complete
MIQSPTTYVNQGKLVMFGIIPTYAEAIHDYIEA